MENVTSSISNVTLPLLPEYFSGSTYLLVGMFLLVLGVSSTMAQLSVIVLFIRNKALRNPMNLIFFNLAVSDLIVASGGCITQSFATLGRFYRQPEDLVCKMYGFTVFVGGEASLICLAVIAFERYLTVIKPFGMGNLTYKGSFIAIVFCWLFASVWAIGPLFGWSRYIPEGLHTWCSIDWNRDDASTKSYIAMIFIVSYTFPVILIVFSYGSVWSKVREMAKAASATESSVQAERAILKMSVTMVSLFVFAWTPYALVGMSGAYGPPGMITRTMAIFPSLLAKTSNLYNAVIYIGMNKTFRKAFFMMVLGRDPFKKEDGENTTAGATIGGGNKVAPAE